MKAKRLVVHTLKHNHCVFGNALANNNQFLQSPMSRLNNLPKRFYNIPASPPTMAPPRREKATIYTDGACSNNGRSEGARAGIGVYWPNNHSNNISEPIDGRQTNQRAEIKAATEGIKQARAQGYSEVTVRTDSQYVKQAAESWIPNWERGGWSKPVVNKQEFQELRSAMRGIDVTFEKVPSASNAADPLARDGARKG